MTKSAPPYAEQPTLALEYRRHAGSGRFDDVSEPDTRNKTGIGFSASDAPTARQVVALEISADLDLRQFARRAAVPEALKRPLRVGQHRPIRVRGRDVRRRTPPAQIRTSGFPASGSYLRCLTAKRMLGQG